MKNIVQIDVKIITDKVEELFKHVPMNIQWIVEILKWSMWLYLKSSI